MGSPLVSICIPTYECEKTIIESIKSALNQTYKNIEIIIVDNCSSDKTYDLLKTFNDPRIKLYRNNNNLGMCENWNECLKYAKGDYIQYLHGDDILFPYCIEKKVSLAIKDTSIVLVFSSTEIINSNNKTLMIRKYKNKDLVQDGESLVYKSLYTRNIFGEPSNVLFKRSVLEQTEAFCNKLKYSTDWEFWLRIAHYGKVGYIADALTKYRVSDSNTTSSLMIKEILNDDTIMIEQLKKFGKYKLPFYKIFIHKFIIWFRAYARIIYIKLSSNK